MWKLTNKMKGVIDTENKQVAARKEGGQEAEEIDKGD